jgi:hypothetical protein
LGRAFGARRPVDIRPAGTAGEAAYGSLLILQSASQLPADSPLPAAPNRIRGGEEDDVALRHQLYGESKHVRNERIKSTLGVSLRYPTYREGLRPLADATPATD